MTRQGKRRGVCLGLVAALLLTSGCFGKASDPVPDWPQEYPDPDLIILKPETVEATYDEEDELPEDVRTGEQPALLEQALVGEPSRLLPALRDGLRTTNGMILFGVGILNAIGNRQNPPVFGSPDRLVWELVSNRTLHTLIVARDETRPDQWNYTLLMRDNLQPDAQMQIFLNGFYRPERGGQGEEPQIGTGVLRYDYDVFDNLPGFPNVRTRGQGSVGFRSTERGLRINLSFTNVIGNIDNPDAEPFDARYEYRLADDGSGEFRFGLLSDFIPALIGDELVVENAVWLPSRAGKGRMVVSSPVIPQTINIDECWNRFGRQVWIQFDPDLPGERSGGNEGSCEGLLADLDLPIPDIRPVPEGQDPPIP